MVAEEAEEAAGVAEVVREEVKEATQEEEAAALESEEAEGKSGGATEGTVEQGRNSEEAWVHHRRQGRRLQERREIRKGRELVTMNHQRRNVVQCMV